MIMGEDVQEKRGGSLHILIILRKEGRSKNAEAALIAESNST